MEKIKNKYDLIANEVQTKEKILVVDSELLFNVIIKRKFFIYRRLQYELTEFNRRFLRHLKSVAKNYDTVFIACIDNFEYKRKILNLLQISIPIIDFETEMNYQVWMRMTNPQMHFAILKRRNYYNKSLYISEDILK